MLLECCMESIDINSEAMLCGKLGRKLDRESIGIIELECKTSGDDTAVALHQIGEHLLKLLLTLSKGLGELLLFLQELLMDELPVLLKLWIRS